MDFSRIMRNLSSINAKQSNNIVPKVVTTSDNSTKMIKYYNEFNKDTVILYFDKQERLTSWARLNGDVMTRGLKITEENGESYWQIRKYCDSCDISSKKIPCFNNKKKQPKLNANNAPYDDTFIRRGKFGQDTENPNDIRNWLDPISRFFKRNQ